MRVLRNRTSLKKLTKDDDSFANASPQELISFMWELTAEIWSLRETDHVERRLQRNVTNLIRNKRATGREKDKLDADFLEENNNA